jgi:hypothetical protein
MYGGWWNLEVAAHNFGVCVFQSASTNNAMIIEFTVEGTKPTFLAIEQRWGRLRLRHSVNPVDVDEA